MLLDELGDLHLDLEFADGQPRGVDGLLDHLFVHVRRLDVALGDLRDFGKGRAHCYWKL